MDIESQYLAALELTRQMLSATTNQQWDALAALEKRRAETIAAIAPISPQMSVRNPAMAGRIAGIIREIEQESIGIVEQVHVWQEHAKILLRMKTPAN
jgi:hypothetical protein